MANEKKIDALKALRADFDAKRKELDAKRHELHEWYREERKKLNSGNGGKDGE